MEATNNIKVKMLHTDEIRDKHKLGKTPSSGFIAMIHFLSVYPDSRVILYGFTWEGWSGHNFDRERKIAKRLEAAGKLIIIS